MKRISLSFSICNILIITFLLESISAACSTSNIIPAIRRLEKIGEISNTFSSEDSDYFWRISSISFDKQNSLFVADSGWNKIFKFDESGKYIGSFGRAGQGPGEFLSKPGSNGLAIGVGNNNNIYVSDISNDRISVFLSDMSLEGTFNVKTEGPHIIDTPHVDSSGNLYLISFLNGKLIQLFDSRIQWKNGIMDGKLHFRNEYLNNSNDPRQYLTSRNHLPIVITQNDRLYALSNFALKLYGFDNNFRISVEIDLKSNSHFYSNYKKRLKLLRKRGGSFISLNLFLLNNDNLGVVYFNTQNQVWDIYSYNQHGILNEIIQIKEKDVYPLMSDHRGIFYCIDDTNTRLIKFQ